MSVKTFVIKRNGDKEEVEFDKIVKRIKNVAQNISPPLNIDPILLSQKVIQGVFNGVTTVELDNLTAETSAYMASINSEYSDLAARISISNIQKECPKLFSDAMFQLFNYINPKTNSPGPLINEKLFDLVMKHKDLINSKIKIERDFLFDYFGFKTLQKSYLSKINNKIVETPQYLWMRVSLGIHYEDLEEAFQTYDLLSQKYFVHATPTLFNAGTMRPQMSSCFLLTIPDDSIEGIFDCLKQCALISKSAGGIGISVHNVRATGSYIAGTGGQSNGLIPMIKVFNDTARYVDQCFLPGTQIYTTDGIDFFTNNIESFSKEKSNLENTLINSFEQLSLSQRSPCVVLSSDKKYNKAKLIEHSYSGKILILKLENSNLKICLTPEHQVLCVKTGLDFESFTSRLDNGFLEREFLDAEDLQIGDYLVFPDTHQMHLDDSIIFPKHKGFKYPKLESIEISNYSGLVYDFEVENTHDYTVEGLGIAHNGGGKRKGAFAIYLEPWHLDIFDFLNLKKNNIKEEKSARDLFYALWIPDLFMKRVKEDSHWTLFCPNEQKNLQNLYGSNFEKEFLTLELQNKGKRIKARELWNKIIESQIETGTPYILYKDACNIKSNQKNLGTIKSSNLCTEIIEYTSKDEVAVCNLASIALNMFVRPSQDGAVEFDHDLLFEIVQVIVKNLNKIIDINFYPVKEAETSNLRHRPIGIGVQGLADLFILMRIPFESDLARKLNLEIFETMYYAAVWASIDLAKKHGTYSSYQGSPASEGLLQYDLWNENPGTLWNWNDLKIRLKKYGLRNSLLLAPMPTASTASILGNTESTEPYTSNIYTRRTLSGEFIMINKHLIRDLGSLWTPELKNKIIQDSGSVQNLDIPENIKALYKTVWEIKQKHIIDLAADRGRYICQSQSMNIHIASPTYGNLTSMHFYGWEKGLKTGSYYLRTKAAANAIQFTVEKTPAGDSPEIKGDVCTMQEGCIVCT